MPLNSVRARVELSFKGEMHRLDTVVDLDTLAGDEVEAPDFHLKLAQVAGIDSYSYLYEVLESEAIEFSEATGLAQGCCEAGVFDWPCFLQAKRVAEDTGVVAAIAREHLGLEQLPGDLEAALLAAYRAGKARGGD